MIALIADKVAEIFIVKDIIKREDKEVYQYGSELLVAEIISAAITFIIAIFLGKIIETICYVVVFETIRVYSGGYHASSHRNCILSFNVMYIGILFLIDMINKAQLNSWIFIGMIVASIIIFAMSPIQDQNKPLSKEEKITYKLLTRKRIVLYTTISCLLFFFIPEFTGNIFIHISICQVSILLIVGYLKNVMLDKRN